MRRTLIAIPTALLVLVGGAYVATAVMKVPPPQTLYKISSSAPSKWGDYFPYRTVDAGQPQTLASAPEQLPDKVPWKGSQISFDTFLAKTHTNSFVVLQDGKLAFEWYRDGVEATTRQSSFSMAKSLVSLLVGQAIDQGQLSESDRLVDLLPDFATGTDYDKITVHNLLDMTAGIDVPEDYNEYWPFTGTSRMFLTRDLPGFVKGHRTVDYTPGTKGQYRSVDTEMLGLILARVTGKNLSQLLSEGIWKPVGAERSARWSLDHSGGHEKAFAGVNATARDYARVGQLVLDDGRVSGQQVLPASWVKRISTPAPLAIDDWGYSAQWWHPSGGDGQDFSAVGIYGQYTYVNPETRTVIVKLSDHGTEQDEQETIDVLRAIAAQQSP